MVSTSVKLITYPGGAEAVTALKVWFSGVKIMG